MPSANTLKCLLKNKLTKISYALMHLCNPRFQTFGSRFPKESWREKVPSVFGCECCIFNRHLVQLGRFLLQQSSSAAVFRWKVWNNDLGDQLIALLLSTVCILSSSSLYCCMNASSVNAQLQHHMCH